MFFIFIFFLFFFLALSGPEIHCTSVRIAMFVMLLTCTSGRYGVNYSNASMYGITERFVYVLLILYLVFNGSVLEKK